jgi:hypothetical protein
MKPQDVIVALDLSRIRGPDCSYSERAGRLGMSASEVHAAVRRLTEARLLSPTDQTVLRKPLMNFITHGVPYAFAVTPGEVTRGVPTAWAAPALAAQFSQNDSLPPVWPDPEGLLQGVAVSPLFRSAVNAAKKDPELYDLLALVDALRIGRAREREIAGQLLKSKFSEHA